MRCDFEIRLAIYLVQPPYTLDLHNSFDFQDLQYSVANRTLCLRWQRAKRAELPPELPTVVTIEFRRVSEFRFKPRRPEVDFSEDDCLSGFGYWTDDEWSNGEIILSPSPGPQEDWLTALKFMSGAMIILQADSAHATITP